MIWPFYVLGLLWVALAVVISMVGELRDGFGPRDNAVVGVFWALGTTGLGTLILAFVTDWAT